MKLLAGCQLPLLQYLDLSGNKLDTPAIQLLQKAKWPKLTYLFLSYNALSKAAMVQVSQLQVPWSQLLTLHLQHVGMKADHFLCLLEFEWPVLRLLHVAGNDLRKKMHCHFSMKPNVGMRLPLPLPPSAYWERYLFGICRFSCPNLQKLGL